MTENKPIRIAQIMGKWVGGGVEAVVINYYRYIDRNKIQFDFICDEDSTCIPYEEIEKLGGKVILIPPYQKIFKYHKELKRVLKEGKYKIVHSHINTLSVFSLFAAKCAGVPIRISHSHATTNKKEFKRNIIKLFLRPFNRMCATNYACCSEYAGRWMFGNNNYNNGRVTKINNAIEIDRFIFNNKIRELYRNRLKIKAEQIVIGHVGRMVETKNHLFLLDIFARLCKKEDAVLILIGQGPLEKELKRRAEELNIKERVFFLGQIKNVNDWYQVFDAFVLPSLYEGFGMALLEAQVSNLPCIASKDVPQEAKLIDNLEFLSLDLDKDLWIETIINLIRKSKRKSNQELLLNKGYDISIEVEKLEKYYINLIEGEYHAKNKCNNGYI